jgi:hypothetical protein
MMHLRFWMMAGIGLAALAATGCSSSEKKEDPTPTYKYPDKPAFCAGLGEVVCSAALLQACAVDKTVCQPNMQGWACESYTGVYRKEVAEDCVKAWESAYSDATLTGTEQANIDKVCELVFGGSGGTGAACTSMKDCDLDQKLQCVKGKCEVPKDVAIGGDCSADDSRCVKGAYCTAGEDPSCKARWPVDAECSDTKLCLENLRCVKAAAADPTGLCQEKTADNGVCQVNAECTGGLCTESPIGDGGVGLQCASSWEITKWDPFCSKTKSY